MTHGANGDPIIHSAGVAGVVGVAGGVGGAGFLEV
jgi:hypothetical protein